jgi:hypothetical protein
MFRYFCLCGCCCSGYDEDEADANIDQNRFGTFSYEYEARLQYYGLCSYDIKRNAKYRDIIRAMDSVTDSSLN